MPENLVNTGLADTQSKMWKRWILWIHTDGVSEKPYISANMRQNSTQNYPQRNNKDVYKRQANTFLEATTKYAAHIAPAVSLCVLSPVVLLCLLGMAGAKRGAITENVAGGIGLIVLLLMVVVAVAVFLLTGIPYNKYEYLEKEKLTLQYGCLLYTSRNCGRTSGGSH